MLDIYTQQDTVLLLVRIVLGLALIQRGWPKIKKPLRLEGFLKELGLPWPAFLSTAEAAIQFFGGILILLGWHTLLATSLVSLNMLAETIILKLNLKKKWLGGYEVALLFLILALVLLVFGPGSWSIDY